MKVRSGSGAASRSLVTLLRERAATHPEREAYRFVSRREEVVDRLTYGELDGRARAVAARLLAAGAGGERALLLFPEGLDFVVAFLGCLYAGVVAVPAYPPRRGRDAARLLSVAADSRPRLVLTTGASAAWLEPWVAEQPSFSGVELLATDPLEAGGEDGWRDPGIGTGTVAFLQYTSGSTAAPKGVTVTHANLLANEEAIRQGFGQSEESVIVSWLPLYHDMGLIGGVLQPLYVGARCVLLSPLTFLQSPVSWLRTVSRYRATTSGGPNFAYDLCVRKVGEEERETLDLESWTVAFNGAEPVRAGTLERFARLFAPCGFRRRAFYPCYGLAEATLFVAGPRRDGPRRTPPRTAVFGAASLAAHRAEPVPEGGEGVRLVGCGVPWAGQEVAIVDPATGAECEPGQVGEIWVAGPSVARGYWARPEETEETFGARLADGRGPFLRTGDLGFLAPGEGGAEAELFVTGRRKDLIIVRGRNHYPQDLELTAERAHPALEPGGGAAFSVEVAGEERAVVLHEVRRQVEGGVEEIAERVRRAVAEGHELQVYEVVLVRRGSIPKTSSGKVRRGASRALYLARELEVVGASTLEAAAGDGAAPPEVALDREAVLSLPAAARRPALLDLVGKRVSVVLRLGGRRPEPEQPLTGLGLDSLAAMELKAEVERDLGVPLPLGDLLGGCGTGRLVDRILRELETPAVAPAVPGPAPGAADEPVELPLAAGQEGLWFLERLAPEEGVYNVAVAARVLEAGGGGVDPAALGRALERVVARHPALRTGFPARDGKAVQRIDPPGERAPDLVVIDASAWSARSFAEVLREEAFRPFELERAPLARVRLFSRAPGGGAVLLLVVHHLVTDFVSLGILSRELGALYREEGGGPAADLPAVPASYGDLALGQEEALAGPRGEELLAYWRERLAGPPPDLDLPTDRPRASLQTFRAGAVALRLPAALAAAVEDRARAAGATPFTLLLALWEVVLGRASGQEDFAVGSPASGRETAAAAAVMGYFADPVALRSDLAGDPSFAELLGRVRQTVLGALDHAAYPFSRLTEVLAPARDPGRSALFQVMLVLHGVRPGEDPALAAFALGERGARLGLGGLTLEPVPLPERRTPFELTLRAAPLSGPGDGAQGWGLLLEHNSALFDSTTAHRMLRHLRTLAAAAVAQPQRRLSELPLLASAERAQLLWQWNDTGPVAVAPLCLHQLFEAQVDRTPDAVALVVVDGSAEGRLSYRELDARADRLARHLRRLGVGPEVRVGISARRTAEMVVGLLAVLKAGGAYVPLDPSYPRERLDFLTADAGAEVLLVQGATPAGSGVAGARTVDLEADRGTAPERSGERPAPGAEPQNLAYLIYTSGSTGRPKGVAIEHRSAVALVLWALEVFSREELDGVLAATSIGFDLSVFELFVPLARGGRVILARDALALPELPCAAEVSLVNTVPSAMAELVRGGALPPAVSTVNLAGEPIAPALAAALAALPGVRRALNLYGPSEDTTYSTWFELASGGGAPPIGRPVSGTRVVLVDRRGAPVPVGVPGELLLGGAGLARGYLGRPALTAERFVPDPFQPRAGGRPGARLYRTGDLARRRGDGALEFLGRIDHQVKVRGFRIELGEIEAVLSRCPGVREAAVVARDDGERGRSLAAYVVASGEGEAGRWREFLEARLPDYMVPAAWSVLPQLPRTPHGKVDRRALARLVPDAGREPAGGEGFGSAAEEILAGIWSEVLGGVAVGREDSFFDLGGHSLLAVRAAARASHALGVPLPVSLLFRAATPRELARRLRPEGAPVGGPIPRRPAGSDAPLSSAQRRIWFLDRLQPGRPTYNLPGRLTLDGPLAAAALLAGFAEVVRRHEALRSFVVEGPEHPVQRVSASGDPSAVVDLGALGAAAAEVEADRLAAEAARRPFDPGRPPLVRTSLLRLSPRRQHLLVVLHHLVADGGSLEVMARELGGLAAAFAAGRPSPWPDPPLGFPDFAAAERGWLAEGSLAAQEAFWMERLGGELPVLDLPCDRPEPAVRSHAGVRVRRPLPPSAGSRAAALGRRSGATGFMVFLAGFAAFLHRLAGQEDLVVGTPVANRGRAEAEGVVGCFVNTLPLRLDLAGRPSFAALVDRVRGACLEAYDRQQVPFERLVELLEPDRRGGSPLLRAVFVYEEPTPPPAFPGLGEELRVTLDTLATGTAKFDLTLAVERSGEASAAALELASDLFEDASGERLLRAFGVLLAAALAAPERPLEQLPLLSAAERAELLAGPRGSFPVTACLHTLFAEAARRASEAVAVVAGESRLTYGELARRTGVLAARLRLLGAGPERLVALCLDRSLEMVVALVATLECGAAYLPLDPAHPDERLAFVLEDARPAVVVTRRSLRGRLAGVSGPASTPVLEMEELDEPDGPAAGPGVPLRSPRAPREIRGAAGPQNLAYVIYTSGSTGRPKGVAVTHANAVRLFAAVRPWLAAGPADVWTLFHSCAFDFSVWEIWGALLHGGRLVVVPYEVSRSPDAFLRLLAEERVTVVSQTPSAFRQLLRAEGELGVQPLAAVRSIIFGGEALEPASLAPWYERHGDAARLLNLYGITETTVHVTCRPLARRDAVAGAPSTVGEPLPDLAVHLLDRAMEPVPVGVPGEICVAGAGLARGYLGRPRRTAERFVPDPAGTLPGGRLYRSGDLARRLPDGDLAYLGRIDRQLKVRGFRIEPGEIEAVLASHPAVGEALVVARGEGETRLVAYVVPAAAETPPTGLAAFARARLPEHMVPQAWVTLDALPLTANGKVDHRALPEPDGVRPDLEVRYAPPRTQLEEMLVGLWAELLGLDRQAGVGVDDDFFALGGHSLLATRLLARLRRSLGVEVPVAELFESPTVAALARRVEIATGGGRPPLPPVEPASRERPSPLSFAQERLWFLDRLDPHKPVYNIPLAVRLEGPLVTAALAQALAEPARRHEVLRTAFPAVDGQPVVRVLPPGEARPPLPLVDLGGLGEPAVVEREIDRLCREEAARPFDLARGPLFRARLLAPGSGRRTLLVDVHHAVADGWSVAILVGEVNALYRAFGRGEPSPLPELAVQYTDYACWQRERLAGEAPAADLAYWRHRLAGLPPLLELPADRPRPAVASQRGAVCPWRPPAALAGSLEAFCRRYEVTPFMVVLAAFAVLLGRYCGRRDIAVGSPVAGRGPAEVEELVGLFVNTLALRLDLAGDPPVPELLAGVRRRVLEAQVHAGLPFERLVEELGPARETARSPLFQVMLAPRATAGAELDLPGVTARTLAVDSGTAKFDLTLFLEDGRRGRLEGAFEYATDLFEPVTVERLAAHLSRLLAGLLTMPERRLSALPLLSRAERAQLLVEWGVGGPPGPAVEALGLDELFGRQARRTPDAVALVAGEIYLSYGELARRARGLGRALTSLGVGPEDRVGVSAERSPELVVALLGVLASGAAYLPLDPGYPEARLRLMVEDSGAALVLASEGSCGSFAGLPARRVALGPLLTAGGEEGEVPRRGEGGRLAYLIYTSGSTGTPKGVAIEHRSAAALVRWAGEAFAAEELAGVLAATSVCFDLSIFELFVPLALGGRVILAGSALELSRLAAREVVTLVNTVPSVMDELLRQGPLPAAVRTVCLAGEPLPRDLAERIHAARPGVRLLNLYGPSEDTTYSTAALVPAGEDGSPSVGRPVGGGSAYVLDGDGNPVPAGVPGELYLGGAGLARGYLARPALTAERFVPHPFATSPGARLYRTGDLVRWCRDGRLAFLGRIDHQVKVRGFRIELGEVETVLRRHPAVREAAVVAEGDGGDRRLVAFVSLAQNHRRADVELRTYMDERLPAYMAPAVLIELESLPLSPNGKVDRRALEAAAGRREIGGAAFIPPRTPTERTLAEIWSELLGVEKVGARDSFFELGGHSLLAVRLATRIEARLGVDLPLRELFGSHTLEGLAAKVEAALLDGASDERLDQLLALLEATPETGGSPDGEKPPLEQPGN